MDFDIATKAALAEAFREVNRQVVQTFEGISETAFSRAENGWTASQNFDHLNRSLAPVVLALKTPKFLLRWKFGKAQKPSRTFTEVKETYLQTLAAGGKARGRFLPVEPDQQSKSQLLSRWKDLFSQVCRHLEKWDEQSLDRIVLPHPLLGKMTVREILGFTLYHSLHHSALKKL